MKKIPRNAAYYTDRRKQNCWCEKCYSDLKDNQDDGNETSKSSLQSGKNDANPEEVWVECGGCNTSVHQICALFNGRKSKTTATFHCPKCILARRHPQDEPPEKVIKGAKELPTCKMSDAIQAGLENTLATAYTDKALELGVGVDQVEKAKGLTVRVVSHIEKKHVVRDEVSLSISLISTLVQHTSLFSRLCLCCSSHLMQMYEKYEKNDCPDTFPVRTKCLALFQSIHGVDVLLFAMFVYEYGQECPAPNRRRVYVSYLDSIQYFEPKTYRTIAYQAMMVEYLRFVKQRGFHTAHIWSCPPTPGDEYIFHCHPKHQQIPKEDMLRDWYHQMLEKAKTEGVVVETTNLHDEFFKDGGINSPAGSAVDPTCLPYFQGDYIPGEIENILIQLKEEQQFEEKKNLGGYRPAGNNRSGSKLGTRSNPGTLVNQNQDKVMLRVGQAISKMKENFIVVRLRSKQFVAAVDRGDDVSKWTEDDEDIRKIEGKDSSVLLPPKSDKANDPKTNETALSRVLGMIGGTEPASAIASASSKSAEQPPSGLAEIGPAIARHFAAATQVSESIGDTIDEDQPIECEMFESRQGVLDYCQTNHCQFDELRRSKHSTLMVLFQLHNPLEDAASDKKTTPEERARQLKTHLELISHAAHCVGPSACKLNNCLKMKQYFEHVKSCEITYKKGCKICARVLALLTVHARSCTVRGNCAVPFCDRIRERNQRLRLQQQLMDDRRRQAQNELYRDASEE
jgi:E1A/CREB-binding protein